MRRLAVPIALLIALLAAPVAHARALWLDAYDPGSDPYAGPVKSQKLLRGVPYVAKVRGTFSFFERAQFKDPFCGHTERRPIYPTPHRPNGPVVGDAEFLFADTAPNCARRSSPLTATTFQIATYRRYRDLVTMGGQLQAPRRDHVYRYAIIGRGRPARFRLADDFTKDNYGRLRITIRRATARDCAGQRFRNWAYPDEAACVAGTQRRR